MNTDTESIKSRMEDEAEKFDITPIKGYGDKDYPEGTEVGNGFSIGAD